MTDRLRDLLDLVLGSLDDPRTDGAELARRAHFSRDHLDRLLAAATGESAVGLRRRLLLERAAWQLRSGAAPSEVAPGAGYGSLAAFSRAFARAYGMPPSAFAASGRPIELDAPNGIHFHPPGGLLLPATAHEGEERGRAPALRELPPVAARAVAGRDLAWRLVGHHLGHTRELLVAAATLPAAELARPLRPGLVVTWFEGEEPSAALMAERLVLTLEVWVAAMAGTQAPAGLDPGSGDDARRLLERFDRVAPAFERLARAVRDRGAWDDAFVDALCDPPESFTYGGVIAHVVEFGAIRRHALAGALRELGAPGLEEPDDPILWERARPQS